MLAPYTLTWLLYQIQLVAGGIVAAALFAFGFFWGSFRYRRRPAKVRREGGVKAWCNVAQARRGSLNRFSALTNRQNDATIGTVERNERLNGPTAGPTPRTNRRTLRC